MISKRMLAGLVFFATNAAAVQPRTTIIQHGSFSIIGNTTGHDCASGSPMPVVGTVGACGLFADDRGDDVFWKSDDPMAGQASAQLTNVALQARSTAILTASDLPPGAKVSYARLYWGAVQTTIAPNGTITLDRPNGFTASVTADSVTTQVFMNDVMYQATSDVTTLIQQNGLGAYRVSGIDSLNLSNLQDDIPYIGWSLVVVYENAADPLQNMQLFDGLTLVNNSSADTTVTGFLVPQMGFVGKLGAIAYQTDASQTGDSLSIGGANITNALNPADNFFNRTRSTNGMAVSVAGDLPQMSGASGSMQGLDFDIVDVSAMLMPGQKSVKISASSAANGDVYALGALVTAFSSKTPSFAGSTKTVKNLTRSDGLFKNGDTLEYTITVVNSGDDTADDVRVDDPLPSGITYLANSLEIVNGANTGSKTDPAGDDQGEFVGGTVSFRVGVNATATMGGQLPPGQTTQVRFRAKIDPKITGLVKNQAKITAHGDSGSPTTTTVTGSPLGVDHSTDIIVDGCTKDSDCPSNKCEMTTMICAPCDPNDIVCQNMMDGNGAKLSFEGGGCACNASEGDSHFGQAIFAMLLAVLLRARARNRS